MLGSYPILSLTASARLLASSPDNEEPGTTAPMDAAVPAPAAEPGCDDVDVSRFLADSLSFFCCSYS